METDSDFFTDSLNDMNFDNIDLNKKTEMRNSPQQIYLVKREIPHKNSTPRRNIISQNFISPPQAKKPINFINPIYSSFTTQKSIFNSYDMNIKTITTSAETSIDKEIEKLTREINRLNKNKLEINEFTIPTHIGTKNKVHMDSIKSPQAKNYNGLTHRGSLLELQKRKSPNRVVSKKRENMSALTLGWESPRKIEIRVLCEIIGKLEKKITEKNKEIENANKKFQFELNKNAELTKKANYKKLTKKSQ